MSISKSQKQSVLNQLSSYLSGNDNVKKVMNSPALDHHGKMLSHDGQKIFTAGNRNRDGRGRNRGRGGRQDRKRDRNSDQGSSNGGGGSNNQGRGGKSKRPVIYTL